MMKKFYRIFLAVALVLAGVVGCAESDIDIEEAEVITTPESEPAIQEESEPVVAAFRVVAATSADEDESTKVNIDGTEVTWSENDKIAIAEVGEGGEFISCDVYCIDAETISESGKYAEFVGADLTVGKSYIAYNYPGEGSIITDEAAGINNYFQCTYDYENYTSSDVDLVMQSSAFSYDGESAPTLSFDHKSAVLDLTIALGSTSDWSGTISSIIVSNSLEEQIFLSSVVFDAFGNCVSYDSTAAITIEGEYELSAEAPISLKLPLTWNSSVGDVEGNFEFTIVAADGTSSLVEKTLKALSNGVKYASSLTFDDPEDHTPTDYTHDGEVVTLQTATVGAGVNLVIVGDGFDDTTMESGGEYETRMREAMEHYFSEEPHTTLRDRYNVYTVKAVSEESGVDGSGDTAFGVTFGSGTTIYGDDSNVFTYALKVPEITTTENLTVITVLNTYIYAGTCYMYTNNASVAYCPIVLNNDEYFRQIVVHEAGGHAFCKLMDEYNYGGTITESEIATLDWLKSMGWAANVDSTGDPELIQWAHLLADDRYAGFVGIYEGAFLCEFGAYRPSEVSIMLYNTGGYNAPSREAIYKHTLELSGEGYDYETFVAYDAINRTVSAQAYRAAAASRVDESTFVPLAQPVVVEGAPKIK